jgi:hypothetical protein
VDPRDIQGSFLFKSQPITKGFHSGSRKEMRGINVRDGRKIYKGSYSMYGNANMRALQMGKILKP